MGAVFRDPTHHDAARAVLGLLTAAPSTPHGAEQVARDLGVADLTPEEVAVGAAVLFDRVLGDVLAVMRLDRAETLVRLGQWIAVDEFAERP